MPKREKTNKTNKTNNQEKEEKQKQKENHINNQEHCKLRPTPLSLVLTFIRVVSNNCFSSPCPNDVAIDAFIPALTCPLTSVKSRRNLLILF